MKNKHLVPVNIQDIAERVLLKGTPNSHVRGNEYDVLLMRLETIRDYCEDVLRKAEAKNTPRNKMNRR